MTNYTSTTAGEVEGVGVAGGGGGGRRSVVGMRLSQMNGDNLSLLRRQRCSEMKPFVRGANASHQQAYRKQVNLWYRDCDMIVGRLDRSQLVVFDSLLRIEAEKKRLLMRRERCPRQDAAAGKTDAHRDQVAADVDDADAIVAAADNETETRLSSRRDASFAGRNDKEGETTSAPTSPLSGQQNDDDAAGDDHDAPAVRGDATAMTMRPIIDDGRCPVVISSSHQQQQPPGRCIDEAAAPSSTSRRHMQLALADGVDDNEGRVVVIDAFDNEDVRSSSDALDHRRRHDARRRGSLTASSDDPWSEGPVSDLQRTDRCRASVCFVAKPSAAIDLRRPPQPPWFADILHSDKRSSLLNLPPTCDGSSVDDDRLPEVPIVQRRRKNGVVVMQPGFIGRENVDSRFAAEAPADGDGGFLLRFRRSFLQTPCLPPIDFDDHFKNLSDRRPDVWQDDANKDDDYDDDDCHRSVEYIRRALAARNATLADYVGARRGRQSSKAATTTSTPAASTAEMPPSSSSSVDKSVVRYTKNGKGDIVESGVQFKRKEFSLPSVKGKRRIEHMLDLEEESRRRRDDVIKQFLDKMSIRNVRFLRDNN